MGDEPVARPLPTQGTTPTQNKRTQTSIPQVGFELTIPLFERATTVHALNRAATVIGVDPIYFFLWLYSPIFGLGRLHETFRFISVSRSRTVGSTRWTGDQLVARPLLAAPGDCDDAEIGGMSGFGTGTEVLGNTCPDTILSTTNPTCQTRARTRATAVGSQRLNASAMARPRPYIVGHIISNSMEQSP
jgi:hypothetical protein